MTESVNSEDWCPKSKLPNGYDHRELDNSYLRCPACNKPNPNYIEQAIKLEPKKERKPVIKVDSEGVDIIDLSGDTPPRPAQRRGKLASAATPASLIPSRSSLFVPGFRSGNAEQERQRVNQKIADRTRQTGINEVPASVSFAIGLARFVSGVDEVPKWEPWNRTYTVVEGNRHLTSDELQASIWSQLDFDPRRSKLNEWLKAEGGSWTLSHFTGGKPRDIAPWKDQRLLSEVVEQGPYEQKPIQGTSKKQFQLHFCWEPDEVATSPPTKETKRSKKRKEKKESVSLANPLTINSSRPIAIKDERGHWRTGRHNWMILCVIWTLRKTGSTAK